MSLTNISGKAVILAAVLAASSAAQAGLSTNYGTWTVDRFDPSGFSNIGPANGRTDVLGVNIAGPAESAAFYNNQGRGTDITPGVADYAVVYGSLYVPSEWQSGTGADDIRSTALWGFAVNGGNVAAGTHYPIVGFTNGGGDASGDTTAGTGRIRIWDSNSGWVPAANQAVQYNEWNSICMVLTGGKILSYVNGALAYTQSDLSFDSSTNADQFNRFVVNTYNYGSAYTAQWSNLGSGQLSSVAVVSGGGQSAAVGSAFGSPLTIEARDAGGVPLPCVPVTLTVPGSGASASLASTTVMTDYAGRASITATARGAAGNYAITASVPGIEEAASISLTNTAAPAGNVAAVPTLGEWALIAMSMLLGTMGLRRMRR